MWAWSFVGAVIAAAIVVVALGAVSEIVLPLTFAAVLAIIFKPMAGALQRHKLKPSLASGLIVLCLLALMAGVVVVTVNGVVEQLDQIGNSADAALEKAAERLEGVGVDREALDEARAAADGAAPMITDGFATKLVEGVGSVVGVVSGLILGALIGFYLLKDGTRLRRAVVSEFGPALRGDVDGFIGDSCRILRDYGKGRSVMSAVVAAVIGLASLLMGLPLVFSIMVVNFVGGYIPYIGAFLGGGLAVIVALGDGGVPQAVIMLVIVLAANLVLENFVEPKVMGQEPRHPSPHRARGHCVGWPAGRDRRAHPGRARLRDRQRRRQPIPLPGHRGDGGRQGAARGRASARVAENDSPSAPRPPPLQRRARRRPSR